MENKKNNRILFISDYLHGGGAEIVLHQLIDGLKNEEKPWEIFLFYGKKENDRKKGNPFSYIYSFYYRRKLTKQLKLFKPNIIHFINYYHILTPSVLDSAAEYKHDNPGVKVFYTAHDFHLLCPNSGLSSFRKGSNTIRREPAKRYSHGWVGRALWLRKWDHRGWIQWVPAYRWSGKDRVFDTIISPGKFMYESLSGEYGTDKVLIIRNPYIEPESPVSILKTAPKSPIKLVFIGRLGQEKGLKSFFQSVPDSSWSNMELHIYGSGPDEEELKKIINNTSLESKCFFYGRQPHGKILEQLPKYDVLLLPSIWYENTPLTIVEAAFAGLRILCSQWGGVKALAEYCGAEYLFNPESKESTQLILNRLTKDINSGTDIKRDMVHLRKNFAYTAFINSHISLYKANQNLLKDKIKALFLDRDGILIKDVQYPHRPEDFYINEDILPLLKKGLKRGYQLFIMTNQSGIGRGKFSVDEFHNFMNILEKEYSIRGINFTKTYYCPYYEGADLPEYNIESEDRKPRPGMFLQAKEEYSIDLSNSIMIGDKDSDRIELPGLRSIILRGNYPLSDKSSVYESVDEIIKDLGWKDE
jgi:D,D-heptose 1,7-bisphosphate phosphatase